ncbi:MAG: polysaccharide pyruvyl transferase family protein [Ardenticatenaceae bacterium]|nr:polysaccharide pyruvyl transferase family protein [Ardenticatenaceae bacterium]
MNILILNVHSALNLGDDGIMWGTLAGLKRIYPDAHITIAANDPESWQKYKQIKVIHSLCHWVADCQTGNWHNSLIKTPVVLAILFIYAFAFRVFGLRLRLGVHEKQHLMTAYYDADLVLSCGGGNFYANHPLSPSFFWNLIAIALSIALGKTTILLPQSVGPINGTLLKKLSRFVFNRISLIMVREPISLEFAKHALKVTSPVKLLPDIAFTLPDNQITIPVHNTKRDVFRIGVTVMDRKAQLSNFESQTNYEDMIVELLIESINMWSAEVIIFAQVFGPTPDQDDKHIAGRIYQRIYQVAKNQVRLIDSFTNALEVKSAYRQVDCLIATRMHAAIFALGVGTPTIVIGYQPKSLGMISYYGLEEYYCDIETVTYELLKAKLIKAKENIDFLKTQIILNNQQIHPYLWDWLSYLTMQI